MDLLGFQSGSGISSSITLSVGSTFGGIAGDGWTILDLAEQQEDMDDHVNGAVAASGWTSRRHPGGSQRLHGSGRFRSKLLAASGMPTTQFIWTIVDNDPNGQNTFSSGTRNADGSITSTTSDAGFSLVNVKHLATVAVGSNLTFTEGQTSPVVLEIARDLLSDTESINSVVLSLPGTQALSNDKIGFLNAAGTDSS